MMQLRMCPQNEVYSRFGMAAHSSRALVCRNVYLMHDASSRCMLLALAPYLFLLRSAIENPEL